MINVDVSTLLVTVWKGRETEILSLGVYEPQHIGSIIEDEAERLGLTFLNIWSEGIEMTYAYKNEVGHIYHFKVVNHSILLQD